MTRWSIIRRAAGASGVRDVQAMSAFCEGYWYPIYAFIRRSGRSPHDAEDLTQSFFLRLMEKDVLSSADPAKGKLRSFLLTCAANFLADDHDRQISQKRGAGMISSLDAALAEERYAMEPVDQMTPDRIYQRRWALTILDNSLAVMSAEFSAKGKQQLFAAIRPFLGFAPEPNNRQDEVAAHLEMPVDTLRSHIMRMRKRWSEIVFEQVADTLDDPTPEAIRHELSELLGFV